MHSFTVIRYNLCKFTVLYVTSQLPQLVTVFKECLEIKKPKISILHFSFSLFVNCLIITTDQKREYVLLHFVFDSASVILVK